MTPRHFQMPEGRGAEEPACAPANQPFRAAFSLTELIGVLAVIAIIAAMLYPVVIRRIDYAAKQRESTDLAAISNALVLQIFAKKTVPHENNWPGEIAQWTRLPVGKITTTSRNHTRAFMLDMGGWLGNVAGGLPYAQANAGTPPPVNARILILSTIGRDLPAIGTRPAAADFDKLWNTAPGAIPAINAFNGWGGRGDDLVFQQISLDPLFHRLVLVNRDPLVNGLYSIQPPPAVEPATNSLAPGTTVTSAFLNGSDVTLMLPDGIPQERILLTKDESYAFSGSRWGGDYFGPGSTDDTAGGFAYWAYRFMKAGPPGLPQHPQQGANPESVVVAMYDFMLVFSLWANKCDANGLHFPQYEAPTKTEVPEFVLLNDLAGGGPKNLGSFLSEFSGLNGLLKPN
jgi:type II secretory pathway pseudopilin PulG